MTHPAVDRAVPRRDLRVGELLAEGGEGRVFELPRQPHLVFKAYRRPAERAFLDDLVAWPDHLDDPQRAARLGASTAWPAATVIANATEAGATDPSAAGASAAGASAISASGVLLPRAPRRFAVRHRDGTTRLATLSYLTADPLHREVAYGLTLPDPVSPERIGLVYALARLLETFQQADPPVSHGDLSTKNVLWSLQRGPEVFVLDCDNCEVHGDTPTARRRAMTPNWDDPAVPGGANPTMASDRYSLALIFLRVVGAANFPIQARQRQGEAVSVEFAIPRDRYHEALLGPEAPVWDLCQRGLSVADPSGRPSPAVWIAALEAILDALGAAEVMRAVWAAQGGGAPEPTVALPALDHHADVAIRPVLASPRPLPNWTLLKPANPPPAPWRRPPAVPSAALGMTSAAPAVPVSRQARIYLAQALAWWVALHRATSHTLVTPGHRREGIRRLAICVLVDFLVLLFGLFAVAMVVSPLLGI